MESDSSVSQLIGPSTYPLGYFNMPKAACTSIKNILYRLEHDEWINKPLEIHKRIRFKNILLKGAQFTRNRSKIKDEQHFTNFTFVRDPGRRAYSAFIEKIWAIGPYHIPGARRHLIEKMAYNLPPLGEEQPALDDVRIAFKLFLTFVEKADNRFSLDGHWAGQYSRIKKLGIEDSLSFIGRVEAFSRDMKLVLSRAGWNDLDIADHRFNEGPKAPFGFDDILDDEIAKKLSVLYRNDYLAFGYKPPYQVITSSEIVETPGFRGQVFVGRPDRLGMRITMFLQAWRFARKINYQTVVYWPPDEINREQDTGRDSTKYPIRDFIDIEATAAAVGDHGLMFQEAWFPKESVFTENDPNLRSQFPGKFDPATIDKLPRSISVRQFAKGLRFKNEKPSQVRNSCCELFKKIIPSPQVLEAYSVLINALPSESFTGVHIRRGDLMRKLRSLILETESTGGEYSKPELVRYVRMLSTKAAPLSSYRGLLGARQANAGSIVLFTDSPDMADTMIDQLQAEIPVIQIHKIETPMANDNQRSFAELLLLSQCREVIGSRSAFSRAAIMIGGKPLIDASKFLSPAENTRELLSEFAGDLLEKNPPLQEWIRVLIEKLPQTRKPLVVKS